MKCFLLFLLFLLSSCGLFSPRDSLLTKKTSDLVGSLQIVGEGRGRLTVENKQNVFSFDAIFKDDSDWIFAASIPLHGEEVLILPAIRETQFNKAHRPSEFERRLIHILRSQKQWKITPREFKMRLRSLIRFLLASKLQQELRCDSEMCHSDKTIFKTSITKEVFSIEEVNQKQFFLLAQGRNLTDSFFTQTVISLYDMNKKLIFSLELFWK
jgi:hypothetical protein